MLLTRVLNVLLVVGFAGPYATGLLCFDECHKAKNALPCECLHQALSLGLHVRALTCALPLPHM